MKYDMDDSVEVVFPYAPKEAQGVDGTWYVRHEGCNYYAKHDSICDKCGAYVKREA